MDLAWWEMRYKALLERNIELVAEVDRLQAIVDRQASVLEEAAKLLGELDARVLAAMQERS